MQVTLAYNLRPTNIDRNDPSLERYIEGDEWKTIKAIGDAIEANGNSIHYLPIEADFYTKLQEVKATTDLLFNYTEGVNMRGADREAQVPMLCEILGIPYTGPDPLASALILNKFRTKQIWKYAGVPVTPSQLISHKEVTLDPKLTYPILVKPNADGSGVGIHNTSIVHNQKELDHAVATILDTYHEDALVEQFLPGREFTIGIVGNGREARTLPIIEINFAAFPKGSAAIDTYEAKFVYGVTGVAEETEFCPAKIEKKLEEELIDISLRAYHAIGCRDFGRLDIRLDSAGKPFVLEINHPPGLMSDPAESSFFTIAARAAGWDFTMLIGQILDAAKKRLKLASTKYHLSV